MATNDFLKIPKNKTTKKFELLGAEVFPPDKGVLLNVEDENGKRKAFLLETGQNLGHINLTIKPGQNAEEELQNVCNLLNGLMKTDNGEWVKNPRFVKKIITLIVEE